MTPAFPRPQLRTELLSTELLRTELPFGLVEPGDVATRNAIVIDAQFKPAEHDSGCIPGAIRLHPSYFERGASHGRPYPRYRTSTDGNLLPDDELRRAVTKLGIEASTHVVVYGSGRDALLGAARVVWALLYAGVARVELLDGGVESWIAEGRPTEAPRAIPGGTGSLGPVRREFLATRADVENARLLVDVRTAAEWRGDAPHHYPFPVRGGHIPGAIHQGTWTNLVDPVSGRMEPALSNIEQRWRDLGILAPVTFYCGTGWRSSVAFLAAWLLGVPARNYDDGWYGWSSR